MDRQLPPQVDQVRDWCLMTRRFEDVNFLMLIKQLMRDNKNLTLEQTDRLTKILRLYTLDIDLIEKIKERKLWWWRR